MIKMLTLGIETTCDETACAIVRDGKEILSNIVSSQIDLHTEYGGVVPELACRRHLDLLLPVIENALKQANLQLSQIDLFAVAHGPGLVGALLIGLNAVKALALTLGKPFIGVNHVEAHLYAAWMSHHHPNPFPALGVVLSGGHTSLMYLPRLAESIVIARTVDDALGEAFDKVAKMLKLPYPGGPQIEALATKGDPHRFRLRAGQVKGKPLDFSFSGLKTAVLYTLQGKDFNEQDRYDLAASFQHAAFKDVIHKTSIAAKEWGIGHLLFGGGVTNNRELRKQFKESLPDLEQLWPSGGLSLDNAAMIAGLGFYRYQERGKGDSLGLEPFTR